MSTVTVDQLEEDPHPALARLRATTPVAWLDDLEGWIVTKRGLCIEVLTDSGTFTVDDHRFSTRQVIGPSMLSLDGPAHRRHRAPFAAAFRAPQVRESLTDWTSETVRSLVKDIAREGAGDLRSSIASPLAALVMSRVLGLDGVDLVDLLRWNDLMTAAIDEVTVGGEVPDYGREAFDELRQAVEEGIDAGGVLADARDSGGLTLDEVAANVAVMLIGGIVTSDGTISIALRHLLDHPDTLQAVRADSGLITQAVEESMRLEPAAAFVDRYATRQSRLGPAVIEEGDLVRVSISAANRDPEVFDQPDLFDIRRANSEEHLAFARGPHACLGFHVARLEARLAIEAVLQCLPGLRAAVDAPKPKGLIFRAPATVPALWPGDSRSVS